MNTHKEDIEIVCSFTNYNQIILLEKLTGQSKMQKDNRKNIWLCNTDIVAT